MEIENVQYAVWIKRWLAHHFDMTMNRTPGYADPDVVFFRPLHSTEGAELELEERARRRRAARRGPAHAGGARGSRMPEPRTPRAAVRAQAGLMFWLTRKRFCGSTAFLISARRE
jgi:hypothetical protein